MRITAFAHVGIAGVDLKQVLETLNLQEAKQKHFDGVKNMPWKNEYMEQACPEHVIQIFESDFPVEYISYPCSTKPLRNFDHSNFDFQNRTIKSISVDSDLLSYLSTFINFRDSDQGSLQLQFRGIFPKGPVTLQYDEAKPRFAKNLDGTGVVTLAFYVTGLLNSEVKDKFVESVSPITTLKLGNQKLIIQIVKFKEIFVEFIERIKDN